MGSESVKFWFRLANAAAKRNLRDSYPKASTEKHMVSLLGEGQLLGLGDCEQCCTCFGRGGAVVSSYRWQCRCSGGNEVRVLGCLVPMEEAVLELLYARVA